MKVKFFDESKISPEVKRLAFCFNLVANFADEKNCRKPNLSLAKQLYEATTGNKGLPALNKDEAAYLTLKFMEMASMSGDVRANVGGWAPAEELLDKEVAVLKKEAKAKIGLDF